VAVHRAVHDLLSTSGSARARLLGDLCKAKWPCSSASRGHLRRARAVGSPARRPARRGFQMSSAFEVFTERQLRRTLDDVPPRSAAPSSVRTLLRAAADAGAAARLAEPSRPEPPLVPSYRGGGSVRPRSPGRRHCRGLRWRLPRRTSTEAIHGRASVRMHPDPSGAGRPRVVQSGRATATETGRWSSSSPAWTSAQGWLLRPLADPKWQAHRACGWFRADGNTSSALTVAYCSIVSTGLAAQRSRARHHEPGPVLLTT